jgi:hypothetical protein
MRTRQYLFCLPLSDKRQVVAEQRVPKGELDRVAQSSFWAFSQRVKVRWEIMRKPRARRAEQLNTGFEPG